MRFEKLRGEITRGCTLFGSKVYVAALYAEEADTGVEFQVWTAKSWNLNALTNEMNRMGRVMVSRPAPEPEVVYENQYEREG